MQSILTSLKNPRWSDVTQTTVDCEITISQFGDEILPFTASENDPEPHGRLIFNEIMSGKYGEISAYIPPVYTRTAVENKSEAERRLVSTDWVNQTDVYDESLTIHLINRDEFLVYRSIIREIAIDPVEGNLDWPIEPKAIWSK